MEADPFAPAQLAIKLGLYASALLAAGLGFHASLNIIERDGQERALRTAALLACAAFAFAALRLAIVNVQIGGSIDKLLDPATLAWTWPALAPSSISIGLGAVLLLASLVLRLRLAAALAAIALAASFALTGHSQALEAPGFAPWAVALHVLIAAFWVAAPISLWPRAALSDTIVSARAERFSRQATIGVPVLFALGLWLAWLLAGGVNALLASLYGQLLIAKAVAATGALALGAYNKAIVTKKLQEAPATGRRALARTLRLDALLFAAALVLVGWATTLTGPPTN